MESEGIEHRTVQVNDINMHVAEKGNGPLILFIHGFPDLWYCWRHQILTLSALGYRVTCFHMVGDLVALLDAITPDQEQVFVVAHDWALVSLSVQFRPRNPQRKSIEMVQAAYGDDYYMCRFQEPGVIEAEFAQMGTTRVIKEFLTYRNPGPAFLPKGKGFGRPTDTPIVLPSWLSEDDVKYYATKFDKTGFTGPVNYYRNLDDLIYNSLGAQDFIHKGGFKKYVPLLEEVVVLEGVAHFLQQEKPDEISKHIHDFVKKFH
ncbi:unnamed protein product [Malus baccata var. baccata]